MTGSGIHRIMSITRSPGFRCNELLLPGNHLLFVYLVLVERANFLTNSGQPHWATESIKYSEASGVDAVNLLFPYSH